MKKYESLLVGDYKVTFEEIVKELNVEELHFLYLEEINNDVLDLLLQAQEDGLKVEKIVGNDIREFCETLIKDYRKNLSMKYKILQKIGDLCFAVVAVIVVNTVFKGKSNLEISIPVIVQVLSLLICNIVAKESTLKKRYSKKRRSDYRKWYWGIFIALALPFAFIIEFNEFNIFFSINGFKAACITMFIWAVSSIIAEKEIKKQ